MAHPERPGTLPLGLGIFARRTTYRAAQVLEPHDHGGAALSIPFEGGFLETFGNRELEVDERCALYKQPGFTHGNIAGPRGFDGALVEFSAERHRWILDGVGPLGENHRIRDDRVRGLGRSFRRAWDSSVPGKPLVLESLALQIVALFGRQASGRPPWLHTVIDALHATFPRRPALGELADLAGVHAVHLAQVFRRHHGCSIGTYVQRLRVEAVREALHSRQRTLAEIAVDTGFCDQSHMTRVFRRATGVTPGRYRGPGATSPVPTPFERSRRLRPRS